MIHDKLTENFEDKHVESDDLDQCGFVKVNLRLFMVFQHTSAFT